MGFRVFEDVVDAAHEVPPVVPEDIPEANLAPHVYVKATEGTFEVILPTNGQHPAEKDVRRHRAVRAIVFVRKRKLNVQIHRHAPTPGTKAADTIFVVWDATRGIPRRKVKKTTGANTLTLASSWRITPGRGNHAPDPTENADAATDVPQATSDSTLTFQTSRFDDDQFVITHVDGHSTFGHIIITIEESLIRELDDGERKRLKVVASAESVHIHDSDVQQFFATKGRQRTQKLPNGVSPRFGDLIDKQLHRGLGSIASRMLQLKWGRNDVKTPPLDRTTKVHLDLEEHGGDSSLYQFTYVQRGKKHKNHKEVLIEHVGRSAPPVPSSGLLERGRRRAQRHGLQLPEDNETMNAVLEALARMPDAITARIAGLAFDRQGGSPADEESGTYDRRTHTATLFNSAFDLRFDLCGGQDSLVSAPAMTAIHEIAHAADAEHSGAALRRYEKAFDDLREKYRRFLQEDGTLFVPAGDSLLPDFKRDRNKVRALEESADTEKDHSADKAFTAAAKKEKIALTHYGESNILERFADTFMIYIADEPLLKALRPDHHSYFRKEWPR
jgi:hypothetical protein